MKNELIKLDKLDLPTFVESYKNGISYNEDFLLKVFEKHNKIYEQSVLSGQVDYNSLYKYQKSKDRVAAYLKTIGIKDVNFNG